MIPVKQNLFGHRKGNCFAACVASILEIPLEDVPNFGVMDNFKLHLQEFLATRGYMVIHMEFFLANECEKGELNTAYVGYNDLHVILAGLSPRPRDDGQKMYHAVVGVHSGFGFKVVHDPHPENTGLAAPPYGVYWIVPLPKKKQDMSDTIKVVINTCHGGFEVSPQAAIWMYQRGFTELATPVEKYFESQKDDSDWRSLKSQLRDWYKYLMSGMDCPFAIFSPDEKFVLDTSPKNRSHPILIQCIEEMGEAANGPFAKLKIVEIPAGTSYEISNYDGHESIHEKHRSWN